MGVATQPRTLAALALLACLIAPTRSAAAEAVPTDRTILLVPAGVFDAPRGIIRAGWAVLVRGYTIAAVGPRTALVVPPRTREVDG